MIRCYITDSHTLASESLLDSIARNLAAGIEWIQIREKDLSARALFQLVEAACKLPNPHTSKILVNSAGGCRHRRGSRRCSFALGIAPSASLAAAGLPGRRVLPLGGGSTRRGDRRRRLRGVRTSVSASLENLSNRAARIGGPAACGRGGENSGPGTRWNHARELRLVRFRRCGGHCGDFICSRVAKIRLVTAAAAKQAYSRAEALRLLKISERQLKSWEHQKLLPAAESYGFRELLALKTLVNLRAAA